MYLRLQFPLALQGGRFGWIKLTQRKHPLHRCIFGIKIIAATYFKCFESFTASKRKYNFIVKFFFLIVFKNIENYNEINET